MLAMAKVLLLEATVPLGSLSSPLLPVLIFVGFGHAWQDGLHHLRGPV